MIVAATTCCLASACAAPVPSCADRPAPTAATTDVPLTTTTRAASGPLSVTWRATLTSAWQLEEEVCFGGGARVRVMPEIRAALPFLVSASSQGRPLAVGPDGIDVRDLGPEACVDLVLDLRRAAHVLDDDDTLRAAGDVLVGSPDVWLWRPEPWPEDRPRELVGALRIVVPDGLSFSGPWERAADGSYRVPRSTWRLMAKTVFGRFSVSEREIGGATFALARLPGELAVDEADLWRWLEPAVRGVASVSGTFPLRRVQVLIVPIGAGRSVPFGMTARGGGATTMLLVGAHARRRDLARDWVAPHELSHLLLPPLDDDGTWFSEGSASYFQNVARARAGQLDASQAWSELVDGFRRGAAQADDAALFDASHQMRHTHRFQQVYWGGAAIALALDVALRAHDSSLDAALAHVRRRVPVDDAPLRVEQVLALMQEVAPGVDVQGLVEPMLRAPFPAVDATLAALGVVRTSKGVSLRDDAPQAAIRRAITAESRSVR
jgi:hypothetical protein